MTHTMTITKEVYTFDELSQSAKEHAAEKYNNTNDSGWWDAVYEDFQRILNAMGFSVDSDDIEFRLSYSQGDYAAFSGRYSHNKGNSKALKAYAPQDETLRAIMKEINRIERRNFYKLDFKFTYSDYYGYSVDSEHQERAYGYHNDSAADTEFRNCLKDLGKWLYTQLQNESEYLSSVEAFQEMAEANEWEFDADGDMI